MKSTNARRVPGWQMLLIIAGVPMLVTIAGILLGAHVVEIVVFLILCLFSVALMYFFALGNDEVLCS